MIYDVFLDVFLTWKHPKTHQGLILRLNFLKMKKNIQKEIKKVIKTIHDVFSDVSEPKKKIST